MRAFTCVGVFLLLRLSVQGVGFCVFSVAGKYRSIA